MAAWSRRLSQLLAAPSGSAWYRAQTRYSRMAVPANTLAPTTWRALPWLAACDTRIGRAAMASTAPRPWLMALAISSPRDCGREQETEVLIPSWYPAPYRGR